MLQINVCLRCAQNNAKLQIFFFSQFNALKVQDWIVCLTWCTDHCGDLQFGYAPQENKLAATKLSEEI
jgi:hypothetical protein